MTLDGIKLEAKRLQPPIMPERVEWMLNSAFSEKEMCSAKNLDNCIGESGKKASHGCLEPELSRRREPKAEGRSKENSMTLRAEHINRLTPRREEVSETEPLRICSQRLKAREWESTPQTVDCELVKLQRAHGGYLGTQRR
jgi:hypothetical protein